jgi:hypothetical protein
MVTVVWPRTKFEQPADSAGWRPEPVN